MIATNTLARLIPRANAAKSCLIGAYKNNGKKLNGVYIYKQNLYSNISYNYPGSTTKTIKTSGCGITAAAMVMNSYGVKAATIPSLTQLALKTGARYSGGTHISFFQTVARSYAAGGSGKSFLTSVIIRGEGEGDTDARWNTIIYHLKHHQPVIISGSASKGSAGNPPYTSGGHYLVLTKLNSNGTIAVNDSAGDYNRDKKSYSQNILRKYYAHAAVIFPRDNSGIVI